MFKRITVVIVGVLFALVLSACDNKPQTTIGGNGSSMPGMSGMASTMPMASMMPSMDAAATESGMDQGGMSTATSDAPFDAQFIDSMLEHHTGAISMAQDALKNAERQEIKDMAQNIIRDQQKEVDQMKSWRQQWYPDLPPTGGMGMQMGDMTVGGDSKQPYDQRFITAMLAHHNGAIAMAKDALNKAERQEIKDLAQNIITAQEAEVKQLQQWQKDWFGA